MATTPSRDFPGASWRGHPEAGRACMEGEPVPCPRWIAWPQPPRAAPRWCEPSGPASSFRTWTRFPRRLPRWHKTAQAPSPTSRPSRCPRKRVIARASKPGRSARRSTPRRRASGSAGSTQFTGGRCPVARPMCATQNGCGSGTWLACSRTPAVSGWVASLRHVMRPRPRRVQTAARLVQEHQKVPHEMYRRRSGGSMKAGLRGLSVPGRRG